MNYFLHLLTYLSIYAIVAFSLNLVVGYCGMLTLAHAAYFAVGSYTCALGMVKLGWGFITSALLGVFVSVILSLLVSLPAWRFKGDFFILVSLAVQVVLYSIFYNWYSPGAEIGSVSNLTNGSIGIWGIPKPTVFGVRLEGDGGMAVLALTSAGVCLLVGWLLVHSPWGRLLKSMRDDELAARGLGKSVGLAKVQAFALSCGMVAVAGAIYASDVGYIDPGIAALDQSILMLSMVIVGGVGNFKGPIVGACFILLSQELVRLIQAAPAASANLRLLLYGLLLMLVMQFRPQGIAGEYRVQ